MALAAGRLFDRGLRRIGGRVFLAVVNSAGRESSALIILCQVAWVPWMSWKEQGNC